MTQQQGDSSEIRHSEANLIHFGNFLLKKYGVMVHSNDGKNEPLYERCVNHADLCNWKELDRPLYNPTDFSHGDKVKVFLMPEGEDSFPGFTAYIVAKHEYVNKKKYDVDLKFDGGLTSRIHNVDEILITRFKQ